MTNVYDQVRMVYAKHPDISRPMVLCAMPEASVKLITAKDWKRWVRSQAKYLHGRDWQSYDFIEVIATIPIDTVTAMFDARHVDAMAIEPAPKEGE